MQAFIEQAAARLDIDQDTARDATGNLLSLIKEHADADDVSQMLGDLPRASEVMENVRGSAVPDKAGADLLGNLGETLGSSLGGAAGPALSGLEALRKTGLDPSQLGPFLEQFKEFALPKLGPDLLERLLRSVPGIDRLLK